MTTLVDWESLARALYWDEHDGCSNADAGLAALIAKYTREVPDAPGAVAVPDGAHIRDIERRSHAAALAALASVRQVFRAQQTAWAERRSALVAEVNRQKEAVKNAHAVTGQARKLADEHAAALKQLRDAEPHRALLQANERLRERIGRLEVALDAAKARRFELLKLAQILVAAEHGKLTDDEYDHLMDRVVKKATTALALARKDDERERGANNEGRAA